MACTKQREGEHGPKEAGEAGGGLATQSLVILWSLSYEKWEAMHVLFMRLVVGQE